MHSLEHRTVDTVLVPAVPDHQMSICTRLDDRPLRGRRRHPKDFNFVAPFEHRAHCDFGEGAEAGYAGQHWRRRLAGVVQRPDIVRDEMAH
jgi:hypothetical protein